MFLFLFYNKSVLLTWQNKTSWNQSKVIVETQVLYLRYILYYRLILNQLIVKYQILYILVKQLNNLRTEQKH